MLNEDLFEPKDLKIAKLEMKIARLEKTIESFKRYDEERKLYYQDVVHRLGELESYVQELEDESCMAKLIQRNKEYRKTITFLNKRTFLDKVLRMTDEEVEHAFNSYQTKTIIKKKDSIIASLRNTNKDLVSRLAKYTSPDSCTE